MCQNPSLIDAESMSAWYVSFPQGGGVLTIEASGECECPQNAHIVKAPMQIEPPEFNLLTCQCVEVDYAPFRAKASFRIPFTQTVIVRTASGTKTVTVKPVPAPENLAVGGGEEGEVTGYAHSSNDVQKAFQDAVSQLYKQYAGHINATVTQIGFVAAGSPIGIAYTYVTMKQQS